MKSLIPAWSVAIFTGTMFAITAGNHALKAFDRTNPAALAFDVMTIAGCVYIGACVCRLVWRHWDHSEG